MNTQTIIDAQPGIGSWVKTQIISHKLVKVNDRIKTSTVPCE